MATLDYRILGPFQVIHGQPLSLGGPRQRAVLALLLLHRGEAVSADRMIDELWGEHPPPTVAKAIHVYISNLRKVVGEGVLLTRDGGYQLIVEADQVDADRFDELVFRGREALERGYPLVARHRLREALSLWRGRPLADFSYHQFAQPEIARLEEGRLAALEDRIEADLAVGGHFTLVPELETHVRSHPGRERLWGQLMVALYRSGRQADALERYRRARRILIDEFAIEPGRELKEIERSILTQDPRLDPPTAQEVSELGRAPRASDQADHKQADGAGEDQSPTGRGDADGLRERAGAVLPRTDAIGQIGLRLRRLATPARPAAVRSRALRVRRAIDQQWHERRLLIAVAAGLLLVAVIAVGLITTSGGSPAPAHARAPVVPVNCSSCLASISAPRAGGIYTVGQSVTTTFSCADNAPGATLTSCDDSTGADTRSGGHGRLNTSTPGTHLYAVTAIARGAGTKVVSIAYRVVAPLGVTLQTPVAMVAQHRTEITVSCSGGRPGTLCRGRLVLKIRRVIAGRPTTVRIGSASYAVSGGSSTAIVLRLTHPGVRTLWRTPGHHRPAQAIATVAGGATTAQTIRLELG
jgi:DNA-binding SARP family transcriptional activator